MKKNVTLFLALFAVIAFVISCKKSNSSPSYHFTTSIDGTATTFNVTPYATVQQTNGMTSIGIYGIASTSTQASLEIDLSNAGSINPAPLVAGTYTDTSSSYTVEAYYDPTITLEYNAGTDIAQQGINTATIFANHFKLVITSIDSVAVKGTFSGDFYANDDISAAKKSFTNGDFYAKIQKP